ncbi:uricase-like [Amphibalanus amphitrite]|uniref:uricase-like n=1 Tax=Amphibalanus amphitrite TaxID=1232801 RepID=UPI001C8FBC98|nr:uricase-like [Amphibalanus amphitrite]
MAYQIVDSNYGKNWVKLLHVTRNGPEHTIREWEVCSELTLDSKDDYMSGDNSAIIATDSQKNTIYLLAKNHGLTTPEEFGLLLCRHFLAQYSHVNRVNILIKQHPWSRIQAADGPHEHAFVTVREAERGCQVRQLRGQQATVWAELNGLQVLKTTQSSFVNFVNDEYRSLPDAQDRVFSTVVSARWRYVCSQRPVDYDACWSAVREAILELFAGPARGGIFSPSVQNTLYLTQVRVLNRLPDVAEIEMVMPNKHYFSVDLSKFPRVGSASNDEVFLPVDKPSGNIRCVLARANSKL